MCGCCRLLPWVSAGGCYGTQEGHGQRLLQVEAHYRVRAGFAMEYKVPGMSYGATSGVTCNLPV